MKKQRARLPVFLAAVLLILPIQELQPAYAASSTAQKTESQKTGIQKTGIQKTEGQKTETQKTGTHRTKTEASAETGEIIFPVAEKKKNVPAEVKGEISVALLSAALPSDVEFTVDPQGVFDAASSPDGQIQSPPGFRVINHSVIPVRLEISRVKDISQEDLVFSEKFADNGDQSFQLVDQVSKAGTQGNAILVLGKAGMVYRSDAEFEQYAIYPGREEIPITEVEAGGSASLQIYGKVSADQYGAYQFTVKPTLKISAVGAR